MANISEISKKPAEALQSDANHYLKPKNQTEPERLPFARIISDEVDNRLSPHVAEYFALPPRKVVIEVSEEYVPESATERVPRAALDNIFRAIDRFPATAGKRNP